MIGHTPTQTAQKCLEEAARINPRLNAICHLDPGHVLAQARECEKHECEKNDSTVLPLYGMPILVKDNICVRGEPTECCSRILKGFVPPYDATVISRLRAAGAVLFGKANMDEFAFGSSCETSCHGPTKNPWDLERVPGGSSGGSAAAVAAGIVPAALGSDTGGSIRQPAALCGVVGLKPTYGRNSRFGLIAFGSSLDQIGPITRTVRDNARLFAVMAGHDENDSTSAHVPVAPIENLLDRSVRGLRIGLPKEYFLKGLDPEVTQSIRQAVETLKSLGMTVAEVSLPHTEYAVGVYYVVATAEASSNLARFDGVQYGRRAAAPTLRELIEKTRDEGFGREAKRRILLGTYVLSSGYYDAYYLRALKVRTLIQKDFLNAFESCDVLITPTSPTAAFRLGEKLQDPLTMYLSDIYTIGANLAGIPALSVPCGFTREGLPVGMQLLGKPFSEPLLYQIAHQYEQKTTWTQKKPVL